MTLARHSAQRDSNERTIIKVLQERGYFVTQLSGLGVPDLLVIRPDPKAPVAVAHTPADALVACFGNPVTLLEVKQLGQKLRPVQQQFFDKAKGNV